MSEHLDVLTGFPAFAVTVDLVVLTIQRGELQVLLVQRGADPYRGQWALPGGFVRERESLEEAALRELREETGVCAERFQLDQLGAFGDPARDPRQRVVTVGWLALLADVPRPRGGGDAADSALRPVNGVLRGELRLAFDHEAILAAGLERARSLIEHTDAALAFCSEEFTISELRRVYEAIWGTHLDAANFHRMVDRVLRFAETHGKRESTDRGGRPSASYRRLGPERHTLPAPLLRPGRRSSKPRWQHGPDADRDE